VTDRGKPLYMIGVVAEMLKLHPQTLRMYERKGLIRPNRTEGKTRLYSADDVEDVARLVRLTRDLGVNLAGVEIILRMRSRMQEMQRQIEALVEHVRAEPARPSGEPHSEGEALVRAASTQLSPIDLF
jgi:MerR family transcriptional regulator/heat shock protein HspR